MSTKKSTPAKTTRAKTTVKTSIKGKNIDKSALGIGRKKFPIVGIGASAGGLDALERLFKAMPDNTGAAFVIVAHLSPDHTSILPELIQKIAAVEVLQVTDNIEVKPNTIYIIPPNKDLAILHGNLHLLERTKSGGLSLPIDSFFRSLAQDNEDKAIGIILSGTGSDGSIGIRAIKGEAGLIMVQSLESAKFDGMPMSAIATGLADYELPPEKMADHLISYFQHKKSGEKAPLESGDRAFLNAIQKIFVLLRVATDHDFSLYKKNTIFRRIERRMHVHQIENIDDYVRYIQESKRETQILFKELLIGVTNFFRDPEAFQLLKELHLPALLKDKPDDYQLRIWVPGCSSGEEAYTIAMVLQECMEKLGRHFPVQIFGTDLDEGAIDIARAGKFPLAISSDVSQTRLKKFFDKEENYYQIKKNIREMAVFAPQNIIKDPPFTKLDLISCRNLLIYFGQELQKKLLPLFHYSLKEKGLLFLGSSETIGQSDDLFKTVDKKWKIYTCEKASKLARPLLEFPSAGPAVESIGKEPEKTFKTAKTLNQEKLLKAILSQSDVPACVVIDDMANILYIHGRTGRFLEPAEGELSNNILSMARAGLKEGLASAIRKMSSVRQEITLKNLRIQDNGGSLDIDLTIKPLPNLFEGKRGLMMVMFHLAKAVHNVNSTSKQEVNSPQKDNAVKRLEDELEFTRENLQTTIEELETSNEELKSTNEELQSTNEELQSTNEELETSKEELQSLNEESATVNSELQARIDDLVAAKDDIKNLLDATQIATIFLDIDLNIRRFTPIVTELFHLTTTDIGRPIAHFATTLEEMNLEQYATKVLKDLGQIEEEVSDNNGRTFRMRIRPYRTLNNVIDGVVVTFEDTTDNRIIVDALTESEELWKKLVDNTPIGVVIITRDKFNYLNPAALKIFGAQKSGDIAGKKVMDLVHEDFSDNLKKRMDNLLRNEMSIPLGEEEFIRLDGTTVSIESSGIPITYKGERGGLVFIKEKLP